MPTFERQGVAGSDRVGFAAEVSIMAGWTGRDRAAVQHQIDELAAIGGIRPASRFEMTLEDPTLGRRLEHGYDIHALPIVSRDHG